MASGVWGALGAALGQLGPITEQRQRQQQIDWQQVLQQKELELEGRRMALDERRQAEVEATGRSRDAQWLLSNAPSGTVLAPETVAELPPEYRMFTKPETVGLAPLRPQEELRSLQPTPLRDIPSAPAAVSPANYRMEPIPGVPSGPSTYEPGEVQPTPTGRTVTVPTEDSKLRTAQLNEAGRQSRLQTNIAAKQQLQANLLRLQTAWHQETNQLRKQQLAIDAQNAQMMLGRLDAQIQQDNIQNDLAYQQLLARIYGYQIGYNPMNQILGNALTQGQPGAAPAVRPEVPKPAPPPKITKPVGGQRAPATGSKSGLFGQ